jgi:hypothetical protein
MGALDRLMEALPFPLIVVISLIILATWFIKELRRHSAYGDTFRDRAWIISFALIFFGTLGYYLTALIVSQHTSFRFAADEQGLLVAEFTGDLESVVQRQILEVLKTAVYNDESLKRVRIEPFQARIRTQEEALNLLSQTKGYGIIWGAFVPPTIAHCNLSIAQNRFPVRTALPHFPDVGRLEATILEQLRNASSGNNSVTKEEAWGNAPAELGMIMDKWD